MASTPREAADIINEPRPVVITSTPTYEHAGTLAVMLESIGAECAVV